MAPERCTRCSGWRRPGTRHLCPLDFTAEDVAAERIAAWLESSAKWDTTAKGCALRDLAHAIRRGEWRKEGR